MERTAKARSIAAHNSRGRNAHGSLRVWWVPQVPGKPFRVDVASLLEAKLLLESLAQYDLFQLRNRIKPDYANAGGLEVFNAYDKEDGPNGSWHCWYSADGEDIDFYSLEALRIVQPEWEMNGLGAEAFA